MVPQNDVLLRSLEDMRHFVKGVLWFRIDQKARKEIFLSALFDAVI